MKKILLGFIAIGLLTFVGCDKEKQKGCTEPNAINYDSVAEENDGSCRYDEVVTETSSDNGSTDSDSGDGTTDDSSVEYGEGATDVDGNTYKSVIIGEQEWFAENLKTSKYSDGKAIPNVTDSAQWRNLSTGAWCNYNNSSSNDDTYGKLYNWYAVNTSKLCPTGWHVPTDAEWTVLTDYLTADGHSGSEGTALKSTSFGGTDDYGWLGLPGGNRNSSGNGNFIYIGSHGKWWSSSQFNTSNDAWFRGLYSGKDNVYRGFGEYGEECGFSVRCLKD